MYVSRKQKEKIMNSVRHHLSIQHMDSLEYPHGLIVGDKIEKNTQAIFDDIVNNVPNYHLHNAVAVMRGAFRKFRRAILEIIDAGLLTHEEGLEMLYDEMMGLTKLFLFQGDDEFIRTVVEETEEENGE